MIQSFKHRGLELFFSKGSYRAIPAPFAGRIERILDRLDSAIEAKDMDIPGYKFHELKGNKKGTYAVSVSGNWRITFQFNDDGATEVNLEDYH